MSRPEKRVDRRVVERGSAADLRAVWDEPSALLLSLRRRERRVRMVRVKV